MQVRFQDTAEADLEAIYNHLVDINPQALDRLLAAIFIVAEQLGSFPLMGRDGAVAGTREMIVPRTDFRLVYTLEDPVYVDIIRVLHGRLKYPEDPA